jgi:hypothetical protein
MEKMGHKHLMLNTWGCRGGVSWSKGGGFSLWVVGNVTFSHMKAQYLE